MGFDEEYGQRLSRSHELFARASAVIPGGAGSSARTVKFGWKPYPPFVTHGTGSRISDVGRARVRRLPPRSRTDDPRPPPSGRDRSGRRSAIRRARHLLRASRTSSRSRRRRRWSPRSRASTWCAFPTRAARSSGPPCALPVPTPGGASSSASRATTTVGRTRCTGATTSTPKTPDRLILPGPWQPDRACRSSSRTP